MKCVFKQLQNKMKVIKSLASSRPTAMRGKAGEMKIILIVFKHFKTEKSLNENAVITLTFNVSRIVKHGVKSPSKIRPNMKNAW